MAAPNVEKMNLKDLLDLEIRVRKAIQAARDRERHEAKQELQALAEKRGFTLNELVGGARGTKGTKVAVKFRNKDNPSDTWTGRGRQPKWLAAMLKKGHKLQEFAV